MFFSTSTLALLFALVLVLGIIGLGCVFSSGMVAYSDTCRVFGLILLVIAIFVAFSCCKTVSFEQDVLSGDVKPARVIQNVKIIQFTSTSSPICLEGKDVFIELERKETNDFAVTECTKDNNGTLYVFAHNGENNYIYATDKDTADAIVASAGCKRLDYQPCASTPQA